MRLGSSRFVENKFRHHCVICVQVRIFFWFLSSCIRTEYGDLRSKTPYLDNFHALHNLLVLWFRYAHVFLKLKIQSISFYAAKTKKVLWIQLVLSEWFFMKKKSDITNFKIITATIKFTKTTKRFEKALF